MVDQRDKTMEMQMGERKVAMMVQEMAEMMADLMVEKMVD